MLSDSVEPDFHTKFPCRIAFENSDQWPTQNENRSTFFYRSSYVWLSISDKMCDYVWNKLPRSWMWARKYMKMWIKNGVTIRIIHHEQRRNWEREKMLRKIRTEQNRTKESTKIHSFQLLYFLLFCLCPFCMGF